MNLRVAQAFFDGKSIAVPPEMRNARPGEVKIYYFPTEGEDALPKINSLSDLVGKYSKPKSADELDAIIKEERDSWGDE